MRYENKSHTFGQLSSYYLLSGDKDTKDLLGDVSFLFTERELKMAKDRWAKNGRPKIKKKKFLIF